MDTYQYNVLHEEDRGGDYEFDIIVLLSTEPNVYYMGTDMGCSCPSPFEDQTLANDFTRVFTPDDVVRYVDEQNSTSRGFNAGAFCKAMEADLAEPKGN